MYHDDALAELHALASLTLEANRRLPQVVTDARDQQHSWSEIAGQLGQRRLAVMARHAGRTAKRRTPPDPD
jgi:hypothetical protein